MSEIIKWDREEVVVLVAEYFRTKALSNKEMDNSYNRISKILRNRAKLKYGDIMSETFRNYTGIRMQTGRIRCIDPDTQLNGMQGTKLQIEVVEEYLHNPDKIRKEADEIIKRYDDNNTKKKRIRWDNEEVIILVSEYFKTRKSPASERDKHIIFVSELLRNRARLLGMEFDSSFRNVAGINMKFANIAALDKDYKGVGLSCYNKTEKRVVDLYYQDSQMINDEADRLIEKYSEGMTE